jgi:hypothetical protein
MIHLSVHQHGWSAGQLACTIYSSKLHLVSENHVSRGGYALLISENHVSRGGYALLISENHVSRGGYALLISDNHVSRGGYALLITEYHVSRGGYALRLHEPSMICLTLCVNCMSVSSISWKCFAFHTMTITLYQASVASCSSHTSMRILQIM